MIDHDLDRLVTYVATATDYDVTDLSTFPDWFLDAFKAHGAHELPPQAVAAAYLLYARRDEPSLPVPQALDRMHEEPAQKLWQIATAFTLSCSLERLKRAGLLESYTIDNPFTLQSVGSFTLPEEDLPFYRSAASPEQLRQFVHARLDPSAAN